MKPRVLLTCLSLLLVVQVQAQDDLELERKTTDKTYHFQEFEALQFEAIHPDEVSAVTFQAKDLEYHASPTPPPPLGNYRDFKLIKITLPTALANNLMPVNESGGKPFGEYLVKREIRPRPDDK
ncbi:hypothetical protein [Cyclobacterium xiamenense]|jgi:hypothetical protein|uniref:hypothetical protein n=1 Tax=Cyclobacterium xiamenense TaxID=1297121 RepID=UPI0012B6D7F9|nr:hypothetical protein [Cyclobacterium xiamenense]